MKEAKDAAISHGQQVMSYRTYLKMTAKGRKSSGKNAQGDPLAMDFSVFNTDTEQIIRGCRGKVYGYVRVSTDHQDYARQIEAMVRLGVEKKNIFKDKKSGKDFERDEFRRLMELLEPEDLLVVMALDRFGRNMAEIKEQWLWITQYRQTSIVVIDQPILNTKLGAQGLGSFVSELILAVFSLMAELEREFISKRMGDGLRLAKLEGKKLGRRPKPIPASFWQMRATFLSGEISQNKVSEKLGVDPRTFKKWMERTKGVADEKEWISLAAELEEAERIGRIRRAMIEYGGMAEGINACGSE